MIQIDMEMPDRCGNCPCFHFENPMYCRVITDYHQKIGAPYRAPRPEWCPLQEVPSTNDGERISVKGRMPEPPKEGPDRGKTIKAIEICYTLGHNCTECPLFSEDDCNDKLMRDALSLLKEQEPRVMTLEEVIGHYSLPPVVLDDLDWQEDYLQDIAPLYFDFPGDDDPWAVHWRGYQEVRKHLKDWKASYGQNWRCWTSRPTGEQRKATPWEPQKEG